ncbi:MAG: hypothetical protein GY731_19795 [Gammaproteobacteria bacterium]|nr:hypothetical protein [Gammaproteobacteria bacterium]
MFQRLPVLIEPLRLVESRRSLSGQLSQSCFSRLVGSLNRTDGVVDVVLDFTRNEEGHPSIAGEIHAELEFVCQRCLEPVRKHLDLEVRLGLVVSDEQARQLPEGMEPLLVTESPMPLIEIVEDELILALPLIPMHSPDACKRVELLRRSGVIAESDQERADNPFAVLESLKSTTKD